MYGRKTLPMLAICALLFVTSCAANPEVTDAKPNGPPVGKTGRFLSLPIAQKCSQRPKEFFYKGNNYFFSGHLPQYKDTKVDWLDARNICREYCMDLVSLETQEKNNLIFRLIQQNDIPFIWTSGRLCDFKGCENRADLEPKKLHGWFWSATRGKMTQTDKIPLGWSYNPWSPTGHKKIRQPDNAEFDINGTSESCMSILNNVYGDGIAWHDIACYHEKPFVCEDNEELLSYIAQTNPGIRL